MTASEVPPCSCCSENNFKPFPLKMSEGSISDFYNLKRLKVEVTVFFFFKESIQYLTKSLIIFDQYIANEPERLIKNYHFYLHA